QVARKSVVSAFGGTFELHVYATTVEPVEHLALVKGDLSAPGPMLVRVHHVNVANDLLGIGREASKDSLVEKSGSLVEKSMRIIGEEGRGVLVLIRDLRPKSVSDWIAASARASRDGRAETERRLVEIGVGSQILRDLGVSDMVLLTNAPPSR